MSRVLEPPLPPPLPVTTVATSLPNCRAKSGKFLPLNVDPNIVNAMKIETVSIWSGEDRVPVPNEEQFFFYASVETERQVGPTCGLLALSLLCKLVQPMKVDDLLQLAIERNLTTHGEMFKAKDLLSLTQEVLGDYCDIQLHKNLLLTEKFWEDIRNGTFFLVPYDKDKNNSPGLLQGHRAHWCIIVGSCVWKGVRFFCTIEGTSSKVAIWPASQLANSNESLTEINPELFSSGFLPCNLRDELAGYSIGVLFKKDTAQCHSNKIEKLKRVGFRHTYSNGGNNLAYSIQFSGLRGNNPNKGYTSVSWNISQETRHHLVTLCQASDCPDVVMHRLKNFIPMLTANLQ